MWRVTSSYTRAPLARAWTEEPAHPLNVLALPEGSPDDYAHVGIRHVQAFIEDPRGDEGSETSLPERVEHGLALGPVDVTGQGHD